MRAGSAPRQLKSGGCGGFRSVHAGAALDLLKPAAVTINPFAPGVAGLATVTVSGNATFKLLP
jgi:hypothetical protein